MQSRANVTLVKSLFGEDPGHPLTRLWKQATSQTSLYLNSLAEDLRILMNKPGFAPLQEDFRHPVAFESARHILHVAALFERGRRGSVARFIDPRSETDPDFEIDVEGLRASVDAKLLGDSEVEQQFHSLAASLGQAIERALFGRAQSYEILIVVTDARNRPSAEHIEAQLRQLPTTDCDLDYGADGHHVWASVRQSHPHFRQYRSIEIYAPVHEKDSLRVQSSAGQSARQLRSLPEISGRGILALGLAPLHDPSLVFAILRNQMRDERYRGIGASLLIKSGTTIAGTGVIDLVEVRENESGSHPELARAPLGFEDQHGKLTEAEPPNLASPVYRMAYAKGRRIDPSNPAPLVGPDVRRLDPVLQERIRIASAVKDSR